MLDSLMLAILGLTLRRNDPKEYDGALTAFLFLPTGEEISTPEPGGQNERDGPNGGGKVQALCL